MAKSKKLSVVLFVLLMSFLGLFLGTLIGSLFVLKGIGLPGPAKALGYGMIGLVIALIAGIVLAQKSKTFIST